MNKERFHLRKNVIHAVVSFGLNIFLVFIGYRLLIQKEGVESLGLWSTLLAWVGLIRLGDCGIANATTRFISSKNLSDSAFLIRKYVDTGVLSNGLIFLVLSSFGYFLMYSYLDLIFFDGINSGVLEKVRAVLPFVFVGFYMLNLSGLILGALQGLHLGFVASRLSVFGSLVQLGIILILVPDFGLIGMALAVIFQNLIISLLGWVFISRALGDGIVIPSKLSREIFKEIFGYSIKMQSVNLLNAIFEPASKILVSRYAGLQTQGLYELAYKTVSLPRNAVMAGANATFPAMAGMFENKRGELITLYGKTLRLVIFSTLVVMGGVIALAPVISYMWLGSLSFDYWLFVLVLAIGFLGNAYGAPAYNVGLASAEMSNNFKSALVSLFVLFFGAWTFAQVWGGVGVVFSTAGALITGGFFIKFLNEKKFLRDFN